MTPTEFYKKVPKDLKKNLEYRARVRRLAENDEQVQATLREACKRDFLLFFNLFGWLYEPRPRKDSSGKELPKIIPFITWPHQDREFLKIDEALGYKDVGLEKARGEGASWGAVWFCLHRWLFHEMSTMGLVSKDELSVDNPNDPNSLFWKLDWGLTKLPWWMKPSKIERNTSKHTLRNPENGSAITGYAATGDVASGGRALFFVMDELAKFPRGPDHEAMASTQHVTDSRFIISTPKGSEGEYFKLMHAPSNMLKVVLDWRDNPTRNKGLYKFVGGRPVAVDPVNNPLPEAYATLNKRTLDLFSSLRVKGYKLEGKTRSPWYDRECDRAGATPQSIAQELDRDYGGSEFRVFLNDFMDVAGEKIREPVKGMIVYNTETLAVEFEKGDSGFVKLWTELDHRGQPPQRAYVCGADIAAGLGGTFSSNSVLQVIDTVTMEQVMEISTNMLEPGPFAELCIATAKWFNHAYLAWEVNGPGAAFSKRVERLQYGNVYMRPVLDSRGRKKSKAVGWHTGEESKEMMFDEINRAIKSRDVTIHGRELFSEFTQYVRAEGKIEHNQSKQATDDAKGKAHGDRVIALGVALMAMKDLPSRSQLQSDPYSLEDAPPHTFGARQQEYEMELKRKEDSIWDERNNLDWGRSFGGSTPGSLQNTWENAV